MAAAEALYARPPSEEQMAGFGFAAEDFARDQVKLLPDVVPAFLLFRRLGTAWNMGPRGPVGLLWEGVMAKVELLHIERATWPELVDDLEVMEAAALAEMRS